MQKLKNLLNKKWFLFLMFISLIIVFILVKTKASKTIPVPTPTRFTSNEIASFGEISPGKTNLDRVNELLGFPVSSDIGEGKEINNYQTSNQFINHQIVADGGVVKLVKEAVIYGDTRKAEDIRKIYGVAPYILYEQSPESYFDLYVYPANGIAYLGHEDGTLLEIWYFEPTTIENFINSWASNYSEKKFTGKPKY